MNKALLSWFKNLFQPKLRKNFEIGDFVVVSSKSGWRRDSKGKISSGPEVVNTRQGEDYFYWVHFIEPEHDLSDDGPYESGQILSRYINRL